MILHSSQPHPHPHFGAWGRCWSKASQSTVIISIPQHLPFYCFIYKQGKVNWENQGQGISLVHPNVEWFLGQSPPWRLPLLAFSCPLIMAPWFLRAALPAPPESFSKGRSILGEQGWYEGWGPLSLCKPEFRSHAWFPSVSWGPEY